MYLVIFDVGIFDVLGANLGAVEVILPRSVSQVVSTVLRAPELGEDLCPATASIGVSLGKKTG